MSRFYAQVVYADKTRKKIKKSPTVSIESSAFDWLRIIVKNIEDSGKKVLSSGVIIK